MSERRITLNLLYAATSAMDLSAPTVGKVAVAKGSPPENASSKVAGVGSNAGASAGPSESRQDGAKRFDKKEYVPAAVVEVPRHRRAPLVRKRIGWRLGYIAVSPPAPVFSPRRQSIAP